jgi:stage III sporulation protein AD
MVIAFVVKTATPYINELHKIFEGSGLSSNYFFTVLKGVAICYVSRFAADTCKDSGQTALSNKAELIGKVGLIALSIPFLKDILDIALEIFLNNKNANGASLYYNDLCTLIFNTQKYTKKIILHEFTHYIQNLLNVETVKVKRNFDKNKLSFLNLSNNDLNVVIKILKDKNEIIPYINEFCEDIMNVFKEYQKINEGLEWSNTFIEYFLKMILNSQNLKDEKLFKLYKHITNNDLLPLYIVIGCYIFDIQWKRIEYILYVKNKEIKF